MSGARGRGVGRGAPTNRGDTRTPWHGIRVLAWTHVRRRRPHPSPGTSDATVESVGKISEAFEVLEDARGQLFGFHRKVGMADLALGEAVGLLRDAGHDQLAEQIETELLGRNVLAGRWTFQVIEEFEDGYYATFRDYDRRARDELMGGKRHVLEAEMKQDRHSPASPDTRRHHATARREPLSRTVGLGGHRLGWKVHRSRRAPFARPTQDDGSSQVAAGTGCP